MKDAPEFMDSNEVRVQTQSISLIFYELLSMLLKNKRNAQLKPNMIGHLTGCGRKLLDFPLSLWNG